MTTAGRNADFSTIGSPNDHIDHYSLSLTGVFLHELHHALCDSTADVALKPPLTTGSGDQILLAYAYYGTTELAYQVTSRSENSEWYGEYKLIYYNADSVNIIAVGGPRYKSAGLDPTWFASMMIPPAAVAVPESRLKPILTKKTERVFVA
ncbi:MAG: hypothetical protein Q9200_002080 [Gallowayella weberi]